jgi:solute carrier family 13 (sodium-dependent dicarboxylate transporter), member 2/3/5
VIKKYRGLISILVCAVLAAVVYGLQFFSTHQANLAITLAIFIIGLWVSESLPMPVVALMPLVLFPLFKISSLPEVSKHYGNQVIFLFLGGFLLGLAIEKWNLHKRIALTIVNYTGSSGNRILLGFVIATGFLSMWLSNTATTMMLFPIALSIIKVIDESNTIGNKSNFAVSLMLIIAYASNFGGMATIIGTPPNVSFVSYLEKTYGKAPSFLDWMLICTPIAILLCACLYFVLTRVLYPNKIKNSIATNEFIKLELKKLGKISIAERNVLIVFGITALLWITRTLIVEILPITLDDSMIAVFGAILLFLVNANETDEKGNALQLLEWEDTQKVAWGILLLFGGGLAIADILEKAGVLQQIGKTLQQYQDIHLLWLILIIATISIFLSEFMSNVAQVIVLSPIICSFAVAANLNPLLVGLPMTLAASAASMLPMGTPPNAIVFSSKKIQLKQMLLVGFIMNIIAIIIVTFFTYFIAQKLI